MSVYAELSMSTRTKKPAGSARSRILRRLSTAVALSTSNPSCVSFSETLRSMPESATAWTTARYSRVAASARSRSVTLSPSRSSVTVMPRASIARAASIASTTVSPAMNRRAKLVGRRMPYFEASFLRTPFCASR